MFKKPQGDPYLMPDGKTTVQEELSQTTTPAVVPPDGDNSRLAETYRQVVK